MLKKIISGGQTGADIGGLMAGVVLKLETGGTAPCGFMTEKGPRPDQLKGYGLVEGPPDSKIYPIRTRMNVQNSDGTLWMGKTTSPGGKVTLNYTTRYKKPCITNPNFEQLRSWVEEEKIQVLNVAGNRESKNPGIRSATYLLIVRAFISRISEN